MVVVASLALAGLSACRSEPAVAAYVGDTRITEKRVQDIWDDARAAFTRNPAASAPATDPETGALNAPASGTDPAALPITRADIVNVLVSRELLNRVAARHNVTVPADLAYDQIAGKLRLPENAEYVRLYTQYIALLSVVEQSVQRPAPLTDDDLRDIYQRFGANGALDAGTTFESFRSTLPEQAVQQLQAAVTVRTEVREIAEPLDVTINPRYQPLEIGLYGIQNSQVSPIYQLVAAELGDESAVPVTDVS
ncbi:hypothetical protein FHX34_10449 [Actinoplanes teichomyceticus]|uniref:SurA-like protein n=2 Tax=Actinoplanes teichomyceticus TaxID=1867 RepID=A0A561VQ62_ACTTI|nr:hypothetical protein FHX34_10449 [Actinoplanes teichomyceticus]GIF12414.1 hypothetical protein Ate01nite_24460 [Actinoplanes teichomyceticus]